MKICIFKRNIYRCKHTCIYKHTFIRKITEPPCVCMHIQTHLLFNMAIRILRCYHFVHLCNKNTLHPPLLLLVLINKFHTNYLNNVTLSFRTFIWKQECVHGVNIFLQIKSYRDGLLRTYFRNQIQRKLNVGRSYFIKRVHFTNRLF